MDINILLYEYKQPPHCKTVESEPLHPFIHSTNIHWAFTACFLLGI